MYEYKLFNRVLVTAFSGQVLPREVETLTKDVTKLLKANQPLFIVVTPVYLQNTQVLNDILGNLVTLASSNNCLKKIYVLSQETQLNLSAMNTLQQVSLAEIEVRIAFTLDTLFQKLEEDYLRYPTLQTSLNHQLPDVHKFIYEAAQKHALLPLCADNF